MSASESELSKETPTPEEKTPETPAERLEREMAELRESGIVKKVLPTISRTTFDQLSPQARMTFMKGGGTLKDEPLAPPKAPLPEGAIRRSVWDGMTPEAQREFIWAGGTLVDDDRVENEKKKS
jgi:hypothetical protein